MTPARAPGTASDPSVQAWKGTFIHGRPHEFKAELLGRPRESIDLFDIERSIQEHLGAMGRELMAAAMKRADSDAPEVTIDGAAWGARGVTPGEYCTVFGWITIERSVYQQAGRGRVAVPRSDRSSSVTASIPNFA